MTDTIYLERSRLILWIPVCMMIGIIGYFNLKEEPTKLMVYLPLLISGGLFFYTMKILSLRVITTALFFISFGFFTIYTKTHYINTTLLSKKLKKIEITGTVVESDYVPHQKLYKIIVDLGTQGPENLNKIKINYSDKNIVIPQVGDSITGIASLFPYGDPVSAYGYDFRKNAYFKGIGASGRLYEITDFKKSENTTLQCMRTNLSNHFRQKLNGEVAEIAIALITGQRQGITNDTRNAFADSGLAHILAISGLHISLVAGLLFLILRRLLSLIPIITRQYNVKKFTCFATIPATFFYVALSGFGYPAIRAFYMTMFACLAIAMDKHPFNMRSLSLAAFLILLIFPESAISVSFQLSFAAVLALIAFYEKPWMYMKNININQGIAGKVILYIVGICMTTIVATLATTPISLYYFKKMTLNSVFANLLAIPLTGFIIMPASMLCVLSYFTFDMQWPYFILEEGIKALIQCAQTVSTWQGSHIAFHQPPETYLCLFGLGFLWLCLFQTRLRFFGFIIIAAAFITLIPKNHLPDIYMADQGAVIAFRKDEKFYISGKQGSFFYDQWKEEAGLDNIIFFHDQQIIISENIKLITNPWSLGKAFFKKFICPKILLSNGKIYKCPRYSEQIIDKDSLKNKGTHLIWFKPFKVKTVKSTLGNRPWVNNQ
jgi:competence protein ComEC